MSQDPGDQIKVKQTQDLNFVSQLKDVIKDILEDDV